MKFSLIGLAIVGLGTLALSAGQAGAQGAPQAISPRTPPIPVPQNYWVLPRPPRDPPPKIDLKQPDEYYADPAHPNIAGFWRPTNWPGIVYYEEGKALPLKSVSNEQYGFPYRPEWQKTLDNRYEGELTNMPYGDPSAGCWPQGLFHNYIGTGGPIAITELPGMVRLVPERATQQRRIYTDGRVHPKDWVPTSQGHSIGHWEGDTLVVDTVGVRPEFSLGYATPHSSQLELMERFQRIEPGRLAIYITIIDPIALTHPIETVLYYAQGPKGDKFADDFCVENNRNQPDENTIVRVNLKPHKHYGFDLPEDK